MIYQRISLKPKVEQNTKLSPSTIQNLKVLQLNSMELVDYINSELETNPLLENDESQKMSHDELSSYLNHLGSSHAHAGPGNDDDEHSEEPITYIPTLSDHLLEQLELFDIPEKVEQAAKIIVGYLDEKGYLASNLEEISGHFHIPLPLLKEALSVVQSLDPAGVGARDLSECLILQLDGLPDAELLETIVSNHLEDIASNRLKKLSKELNITLQRLENLIDIIRSLDPKPGLKYECSCYSGTEYIVPEIVVTAEDGELSVNIADSLYPKLLVNERYRKLLEGDPNSREYLTEKLNRTILVLKSIEQRRQTLMSVSKAIVSFQRDFFLLKGGLAPLNLKDVAEAVNVHESTVSRAIRGKYVSSPAGIHPMKYFFSNRLSSNSDSSVDEIKKKLKELLDGENPFKPYSDQKLSDILSESGHSVARRTVAKYREELGIASSSLRKKHK